MPADRLILGRWPGGPKVIVASACHSDQFLAKLRQADAYNDRKMVAKKLMDEKAISALEKITGIDRNA